MVRPERFELPTTRFEAECSIQLSYGRKMLPKSSDPNSNDIRKRPADHRGHFLVTPEFHPIAAGRKSLIALPISTILTSDLDVRSQVLYPAELRAQPAEVYLVRDSAARPFVIKASSVQVRAGPARHAIWCRAGDVDARAAVSVGRRCSRFR